VGLDFGETDLSGLDFAGADLQRANLSRARGIDPLNFVGIKHRGIRWPRGRRIVVPPEGFSLDRVREMVLAGAAPPTGWVPFVRELNLMRTKIENLESLRVLVELKTLNLRQTSIKTYNLPKIVQKILMSLNNEIELNASSKTIQKKPNLVDIFAPLNIIKNEQLHSSSIHVEVILKNINRIVNNDRIVLKNELKNYSKLFQNFLMKSKDYEYIDILAPLQYLKVLHNLDLSRTRVSDVSSLIGLVSLQRLDLSSTEVNDLAPLAGLASLRRLYLRNTPVSDVAPLAGLTALRSLDLKGSKVSDVTPLVGVSGLRVRMPDGTVRVMGRPGRREARTKR
jgi:hypothetical protein